MKEIESIKIFKKCREGYIENHRRVYIGDSDIGIVFKINDDCYWFYPNRYNYGGGSNWNIIVDYYICIMSAS